MVGQSHVKDLVSSGHDVRPWHVGQRLPARLNSSVLTNRLGGHSQTQRDSKRIRAATDNANISSSSEYNAYSIKFSPSVDICTI